MNALKKKVILCMSDSFDRDNEEMRLRAGFNRGLRRREPHPDDLSELVRAATYMPLAKCFMTPDYVRAVGFDGAQFVTSLCLAYSEGRYRHRGFLRDGWFAIPDRHLATAWGFKTTSAVRKA